MLALHSRPREVVFRNSISAWLNLFPFSPTRSSLQPKTDTVRETRCIGHCKGHLSVTNKKLKACAKGREKGRKEKAL